MEVVNEKPTGASPISTTTKDETAPLQQPWPAGLVTNGNADFRVLGADLKTGAECTIWQ